ncbi:MAG: HPr family phosphocarrier protein [Caldilineales bacterium]|nr:HPr family phosphocarrier protein [Caldilineales bacterium]
MKQATFTIGNATGLHARPAKTFVNAAKQFKADIRVHHEEKIANAKSLISMLTLGVERGQEIRIVVDGDDEVAALAALAAAIASGLGEDAAEAPASPPPPAVSLTAAPPQADVVCCTALPAPPASPSGPIFQLRQDSLGDRRLGHSARRSPVWPPRSAGASSWRVCTRKILQGGAAEAAILEVHLRTAGGTATCSMRVGRHPSGRRRCARLAGDHRKSRPGGGGAGRSVACRARRRPA